MDHFTVNLRRGDQKHPDFGALNASHLVPVFEDGEGVRLSQSLAIIEYLDETLPNPPLLPGTPIQRATIREIALAIVADIHPLGNLRVLDKLSSEFNLDAAGRAAWNRYWISEGFAALEKRLDITAGQFAVGDEVTLADVCLVPQVYNARRFGLDLSAFPRISALEARAQTLAAFANAAPEAQGDAE